MKVKKLLSVLVLLISGLSASAQSLSATNVTIESDGIANVDVSMIGVDGFVSSGFVITLPSGFTISNSEGVVSDHELRVNMLKTNTLKAAVYSMNNSAFKNSENGMLSFQVNAEGVKEGVYQGVISHIEFASAEANLTKVSNVSFNIEVLGPPVILGDANGDGNVNVTDYTAMSHYIMGNPPEDFNEKAADTNGDGKINVADYTGLAHLILYGTVEKPENAKQNTSAQQVE